MVIRGQEIPKTHNLSALQALLVEQGLSGPLAIDLLETLTPFAVNDKYPSLQLRPISRDAAAGFVPAAEAAVAWLSALLAE